MGEDSGSKKKRITIPQLTRIRAELQKEIGSICPFCDNNDVGHFQIHHIDEDPSNNGFENLLLVCPTCHSKITKNEISQIDVLKKKIFLAHKLHEVGPKTKTAKVINFNKAVGNAVVGDGNQVVINQSKKKIVNKYPEGCIGYDTVKSNYIGYLIDRYHKYKEADVGKENMNYAIFPSSIKRHFSIGKTRTIYNIPIEKFDEVCLFIQKRIDGTILGKIKRKTQMNYSLFEEYKTK